MDKGGKIVFTDPRLLVIVATIVALVAGAQAIPLFDNGKARGWRLAVSLLLGAVTVVAMLILWAVAVGWIPPM